MSTIKKNSGFGVAQIILLISIAILVIFVAWPVLLILFNACCTNNSVNLHCHSGNFCCVACTFNFI